MAIAKLRRVQLGRETTAGTPVAATTTYRVPATGIKDDRELTIPDEDVGYLSPVDRGYFAMSGATLEIPETPVTFEQILHVLEAGLMTATPAGNGGTSNGYIYVYNAPTTAKLAIKTYTIRAGDETQAYVMPYAFVEAFSVTGASQSALTTSQTWRGQQRDTTTFTALSGLPVVEEALFAKTKFYMDAAGGTLGATQKTQTLLGYQIDTTSGWRGKFTAEGGTLGYTFLEQLGADVTGRVTFEYNANAVSAEAAFVAGTTQLLRFDTDGSALTGAGGTYTTKKLRFDAAVKIISVDVIGEQDGNDIVTLNWRAVYNAAADLYARWTVVVPLSAVP